MYSRTAKVFPTPASPYTTATVPRRCAYAIAFVTVRLTEVSTKSGSFGVTAFFSWIFASSCTFGMMAWGVLYVPARKLLTSPPETPSSAATSTCFLPFSSMYFFKNATACS